MYLYMHNKTVKRRVNRKIGGGPTGTKRKMPTSLSPYTKPTSLSPYTKLERNTKKIKTEEEMEPAITSEYIDSDVSVSSNESGKPPSGSPLGKPLSGTPLFVKRKKGKDVGYISKVIKSSYNYSVGKKRGIIVPVMERSKDDGDLPDRRVRIADRTTARKQKPGSLQSKKLQYLLPRKM